MYNNKGMMFFGSCRAAKNVFCSPELDAIDQSRTVLLRNIQHLLFVLPAEKTMVKRCICTPDADEAPKDNVVESRRRLNEGSDDSGRYFVRKNNSDEDASEKGIEPLQLSSSPHVIAPPAIVRFLCPHQRNGVAFMYQCVMGMKSYNGQGCILADDMGLGKTLQSVALIYTLLKTGFETSGQPTAKRVIVVCPSTLVNNWDNEFYKWVGVGDVRIMTVADKASRKSVEKNIDLFVQTRLCNVLIVSYECLRLHIGRLVNQPDCCDLLVCDEAHRLKNTGCQIYEALNSLPVRRRVLLTGTPIQNDLHELFAMVDFTNPGVLGSKETFHRNILSPILRGREPNATNSEKRCMSESQNRLSSILNEFVLRQFNTLNIEHVPPKLTQVVCCNMTEIQRSMYEHILESNNLQQLLDGQQRNCLGVIQTLMKICNHPSLIHQEPDGAISNSVDDSNNQKDGRTSGLAGVSKFLPVGHFRKVDIVYPEWSGKMIVLYQLMKEMRKPNNGNDKIVIVSNYTQTLDLIGKMCCQNGWGFFQLDGSVPAKKRQHMVDEFNDPLSSSFAFLLSSKAGGCGLNLTGANRLVVFDPDWNPAVDKQAAARCWQPGQEKRCFTYRLLTTGSVDEKIFQRQLSKEGLQSVVMNKDQVNTFSTKTLRNLFKLQSGTPSDTHDILCCKRCHNIDHAKGKSFSNTSTDVLDGCAHDSSNAQNSTYQEQIGMPDDKDLHNWSHHYSTETTDDQVFRDAMRGCDVVSFVFGLEVTWSLVQK